MEYITREGDYLTAYHFCLEKGGQLFPGNGKDSANVVLIGRKCYTFWANGSKRLVEVQNLANFFNISSEGQTGGRIARWLIEEVIRLPYQATYWSKTYRNIAKSGEHWHYMKCDNKAFFWAVEIDIKSAYFSSLFSFPSLLYHPRTGYLDDKGSMNFLRELYPYFPKWFRLQFLGVLSSWKIFYLCRNKHAQDNNELIAKTRYFIKYNAGFNVAHRAIIRNYKIMKKIHEIGGQWVRRIHTDSFLLDVDIPKEVEFQIWEYLKQKGLEISIKGFGLCYFWDINTGFIGNRFVGASIDVTESMRKNNIKMKKIETNEKVFEKLSKFEPSEVPLHHSLSDIISDKYTRFVQQSLFNTSEFSRDNSIEQLYLFEH